MLKVNPSALKHGIDARDLLHAADNAVYRVWLDDEADPRRELVLGFDKSGRLFELVILWFDSGNGLIAARIC